MTCRCEKNKCAGKNPANVLEVHTECGPVLFHKVTYPASLGDDTTVKPETLSYRNVLLTYEANNHSYLYSSDGVPTFISLGDVDTAELEAKIAELGIQVEQNTTAIQTNVANLAEETEARKTTDSNLQEQLTDLGDTTGQQVADLQSAVASVDAELNTLQNTTVQKDTVVSGNGSTVTITKTTGALNEDGSETAMPLPVASETDAGVMNPATFKAVQENSENIDSILNGAVAVENIRSDVTQAQLTIVWQQNTGKTELINRASIYDITNKKVWTYYENKQEWLDMPAGEADVTVSQATNESLGIVKGSTEDGQIAVEADGTMSLNGYDGLTHDVDNLAELVAGIEVPKVGEYTYGYRNPGAPPLVNGPNATSGSARGWSFKATNSNTGVRSETMYVMPIATPGTTTQNAGLMSGADKSKLDSLLEIKSLNDSLELDENGQLSVVGGGGSSGVNLLSTYTATVEDNDVYNAGYINGRLNLSKIAIGENAANSNRVLTNNREIAIGYNARTNNASSFTNSASVAIGSSTSISGNSNGVALGAEASVTGSGGTALGASAKANQQSLAVGESSSCTATVGVALGCESICSNSFSLALGHRARSTRQYEASVGGVYSGTLITRYLANVRAGELDTDAVNLKQMQDYVAEHAGGDSNINLGKFAISGPQTDTLLYPILDVDDITLRGNVAETDTPGSGADLAFCTLPAATTLKAGVMTAADKVKMNALGVGSLTNMDGVLQSETEVQIEFARANLTTGASETQTATIEAATSEEAGVMLASDKVKLDAIPALTEMQWTRTGNLPPAVVTGFEDTTYGTDTITMHLDTKDLATGGVAVQELMLEAATANTDEAGGQAGIMTAFQATQLAALAARPQVIAATADEITAAWEAA